MAKDTSKPDDEGSSDEQGADDEQETALVPKSFFQSKDIEVGKKCEVKVEGIYDDEVEISYVPHKKKDGKNKSDSDSDSEGTMKGAMDRMDRMGMAEPMGAPPAPGGY